MTSSIDKIMDSFPYPSIPPIIGQPGYDTISEVHLKLSVNAASIQPHLGCGTLGLFYVTVTPDVYNMLYNIDFIPPTNPGIDPNIPEYRSPDLRHPAPALQCDKVIQTV